MFGGAVEIIEHREKALCGLALRTLDLALALFFRAAAVVGILRLQALEITQ